MMMKWIYIFIAFLISCPVIQAQDTISNAVATAPVPMEKPAWKDKLYFGGYVNFSLGSYTMIGIEPMAGYKIIPRLSAGLKLRYDYISDRRYSETYNTSNYGASLFSRLSLFKGIYLHAEFAGYNYELFSEGGTSEREWVPFFFVGAGLRQPVGKRTSINAQVVFDVLHSTNSPYGRWEPFYSVGVGVGF